MEVIHGGALSLMRRRLFVSNKTGFTILEMIIVVIILALLGSVALLTINPFTQDARREALRETLHQANSVIFEARLLAPSQTATLNPSSLTTPTNHQWQLTSTPSRFIAAPNDSTQLAFFTLDGGTSKIITTGYALLIVYDTIGCRFFTPKSGKSETDYKDAAAGNVFGTIAALKDDAGATIPFAADNVQCGCPNAVVTCP